MILSHTHTWIALVWCVEAHRMYPKGNHINDEFMNIEMGQIARIRSNHLSCALKCLWGNESRRVHQIRIDTHARTHTRSQIKSVNMLCTFSSVLCFRLLDAQTHALKLSFQHWFAPSDLEHLSTNTHRGKNALCTRRRRRCTYFGNAIECDGSISLQSVRVCVSHKVWHMFVCNECMPKCLTVDRFVWLVLLCLVLFCFVFYTKLSNFQDKKCERKEGEKKKPKMRQRKGGRFIQ